MRVTHLNTNDIKGGASKAAYRINQALKYCHINSNMLVKNKLSDELGIYRIISAELNSRKSFPALGLYLHRKSDLFSIGNRGLDVSKGFLLNKSDIINLHWINGDFLSLESIKKIGELNKPIVWTLHDMWAFTGGCHYSGFCDLYEETCGRCPFLNSNEKHDLSRQIWEEKYKTYQKLNLSIVTCSSWLGRSARRSSLLKKNRIKVIPNPIDVNLYKPIHKNLAKNILNLPLDKKLILFGAMNALADERKGFKYFKEALHILYQINSEFQNKVELLVFGASHINQTDDLPFKINFMGTLADDFTLALCYNAADVFVAPSLEDNLPNTVMEALSCATPVVGFNTGGIPDLIAHQKNGYLAEFKSSRDLAKGMQLVLENNDYNFMGREARNYVVKNYSVEVVTRKYIRLYEKLIQENIKTKKPINISYYKDILIIDDKKVDITNQIAEKNSALNIEKVKCSSFATETNQTNKYDTIICRNILCFSNDIIHTISVFNRLLRSSGTLYCNWDLFEKFTGYHLVFTIEKILSCMGFSKAGFDGDIYRFIKESEITNEDIKIALEKYNLSKRLKNHLININGIMTQEFIDLLFKNCVKVGIFGAGEYGKMILELIKSLSVNIKVKCFFDNEQDKWSRDYCGITVHSPESSIIKRLDKIIVASIYGKTQIEQQLIDLGLARTKIINIYGN